MDKFKIIRSPRHKIDLALYQTNTFLDEIKEILNGRVYTAKQTGLTPRVINHWKTFNVLPEGLEVEKESWAKFSLIEIVWLRITKRLRNFGVSLEHLVEIKEQIMDWDERRAKYPEYEYFIAKTIADKFEAFIVILSDFRAYIATPEEIEASKKIFGDTDMLLISIRAVLREMNVPILKSGNSLFSVTEDQKEVLKSLNNKITELRVYKNNKKILGVDEISETNNPKAINDTINEMKKNKEYGGIETKTVNGQIVHLRKTKKRKLAE